MKQRNKDIRLDNRRTDYHKMMADRHTGQGGMQTRLDTGGYHKPGSNKK